MTLEQLVTDLKNDFITRLNVQCKMQKDITLVNTITNKIMDDGFTNYVLDYMPQNTILLLKGRLKVMTGRTYPKFMNTLASQYKGKFKEKLIEVFPKKTGRALKDWEQSFINNI